MCAIAGLYNFTTGKRIDRHLLQVMRNTMVHRGPDSGSEWIAANGHVGLAHCRLTIIDLDPKAGQPMSNEDNSIWLTFNGEIYNHLALRQQLIAAGHQFNSHHSDSEVIVHGYEQWGIDGLLQRLEGMFAFGLWDANKQLLTLVRDRIGIKPLYFAIANGMLRFASEIKAIVADPNFKRDIDLSAMYHYLSFMTTPAPMTMFKDIFKLPAGHYLQFDSKGNMRGQRYWDAIPGQGIAADELKGLSNKAVEDFYIQGIRSRLLASVEQRMMSDVPFGVFLSGGVDSSTNVALMSRYTQAPLDTFTVGFADHKHLNELEYAKQVAKLYGCNHHEVLVDEQDMVAYLQDLIHYQDEPIADWVCVPLYFVSKLAADHGVKVVQVGEGSDEQFCGYASYMGYLRLYQRYWQPFRRLLPQALQSGIAALARQASKYKPGLTTYADIINRAARNREHFWSGATVFWELAKAQLLADQGDSSQISSQLMQSGLLPDSYLQADSFNVVHDFQQRLGKTHAQSDVLTRMIYNEFKLRLPELLLMRVDKISMSVSLEARVPFLDHRFVEYTMDIPMHWKVKGGEPKYLLKKAVQGWLPDNIIYRKKMGFAAPMAQWLRGEFGKQVAMRLLSSRLMGQGYFNRDYVNALLQSHREHKADNSVYIWTLFNLVAWFDYWIDNKKLLC